MAAAHLTAAAGCLGLLIAASPAAAAFPGQNGKIAFERGGEIFVMNPDGSAQTNLTNTVAIEREPAWSADGQKIAFQSDRDGNREIYVMNVDGSAQTRLTTNAAVDGRPAWSPDGQKIAFDSGRSGATEVWVMNADGSAPTQLTTDGSCCGSSEEPVWSPDGQKIAFDSSRTANSEIWVMNADGSAQTNITNSAVGEGQPAWSPDGQRIAFTFDGILVMNADGSGRTHLTTTPGFVDTEPAWSPDGQKVVFRSTRGGGGNSEIFVMNADGSAQTPVTSAPGFENQPDWQAVPGCLQVGFPCAQGSFTETAPGSGIFETAQKAWVGGFEIQPRPGGKLVVNTRTPGLSASGAGVDVIFAGFAVPIPVAAIPVGVQDASFEIGTPGTLTSVLEVPVESSVKLSWTDCAAGGRACKSASYEQEVKLEELTAGVGELVTLSAAESVGEATGMLKARLENGKGFVLESGEISIDEINVIPSALRIPRTLKLKDLLLKFEIKEQKPFWTGRAGIGLPLARGELDVTGTGFVFDGSPAGGGFEVDGINRQVLGPLFLQRVGGDLLFAPAYGMNLRVGATVGPQVAGQKLISLDGTVQGGSLVSDCSAGPDPAKLEAKAKLPALEAVADVDITERACIYPGTGAAAAAIEGVLEGEIDFLDGALGYKGTQTGFVSEQGASYEGSAQVSLPGLPDLDGSAIVSTVGLAACTDLSFFEGGFGYRFGTVAPLAFTGCDLGQFRVVQSSPARLALRGGSTGVQVPGGLPHAGFAATGISGPPLVRVTGPGGVTVESPADGSALRSGVAVIVPVAGERRTYVFVNNPRAGNWQVEALDPANPLTGVSFAEGLPEPKVKGRVSRPAANSKSKKLRLTYELPRRISGQKVIFTERGEGIAHELGTARGDEGTISFKPTLATDRKRTIEAQVIQDGLPRELIAVARFKAPPLPKLKVAKLEAKRRKGSLKLSWARVGTATNYLAEVTSGSEVLFRVLTAKHKLRFDGTPADGKLKVAVQALSETQPPGPIAKLKIKAPR